MIWFGILRIYFYNNVRCCEWGLKVWNDVFELRKRCGNLIMSLCLNISICLFG